MMTPTKNKITKEEFLEQLYKNNGNAYKTYTEMGLPYNIYYNWKKEDEDFAQKVEDSRKKQLQWVESKLFDGIENGDVSLIKFYLNCKGGYVSNKNVQVQSTNTVDVNNVIDDIKQDLNNE